MDSGDDSEETDIELVDFDLDNWQCIPASIYVFGIHKATLEGDLDKAGRFIESGESVNKRERHYKFSPLHLAVISNNLELLDYLLGKEGIEVDARCSKGRTPLYLAASLGRIELVEKLIHAGSDVNITDDNNDAALHESVCYPDICDLLVRRGAQIHTDDSRGTTLHEAVRYDCLKILHMLLYYNVDANVPDPDWDYTPFMVALDCHNVEAQQVLLEYVDDFSGFGYNSAWPILASALSRHSPFVKDIIERGADVNYGDDPWCDNRTCAFSVCLHHSVDASTFKLVWERLEYNATKNTIDLLDLLSEPKIVSEFLRVVVDSDNFEPAVEFFSRGENYFLFVNKFAEGHFELEQLSVLTCRLLQYGFRASSYDVHAIFSHYGYCELFRILLYMDNDFSPGWQPQMALSRLMFDVDYNLESVIDKVKDIPRENVLQLLEYSIYPHLVDALILQYSDDGSMSAILSDLPRVPLLIELARNPARKHIWRSFKVANTCQIYTTIVHLSIATFYKDVLTFKRKIYRIK